MNPTPPNHAFVVETRDRGLRLDVWLHARLPTLSRSRIQGLIKAGNVTLDGEVHSAHAKVAAGQRADVVIPPAGPIALSPEAIPLDIIHEDADIIVINKPAGLVVHPAPGHAGGTLVNALLYHCDDLAGIGGELRPGIVHRLDKDTTGAIVVAKNELAMAALVGQFKSGEVTKQYAAIVQGIPAPPSGTVQTPIGRSDHDRKKMSSCPASGGRMAVTHYEVAERFRDCSSLCVRIETGRTHQIRVHMAHIGHPVIGDRQYRGRRRQDDLPASVSRQMLHARHLAFDHPRTGRRVRYSAPLPADMAELLAALRGRDDS